MKISRQKKLKANSTNKKHLKISKSFGGRVSSINSTKIQGSHLKTGKAVSLTILKSSTFLLSKTRRRGSDHSIKEEPLGDQNISRLQTSKESNIMDNNNNKQDPRIKKYNTEPERIYYHCTSLRRLLKERKDIELLQSLENSLRQQNLFKDKEKKEGCYRCGDKSHWIKDCTQPENYKKKPPYGECYYCHSPSHWVPNCPHIEKALSDENMPSTSSQQEQEETSSSSMTTTKRKTITFSIC